MAKPIGTMGLTRHIVVGGTVLPTDGLIVLSGSENNGGGTTYSTLRDQFGSSGYTPSGSNRFLAMCAISVQQTSSGGTYIGYGDNDVGVGSLTVPTNAKYPANNTQSGLMSYWSANTGDTAGAAGGATNNGFYYIPLGLIIPNAKYIFVRYAASTNWSIRLFGYEVT